MNENGYYQQNLHLHSCTHIYVRLDESRSKIYLTSFDIVGRFKNDNEVREQLFKLVTLYLRVIGLHICFTAVDAF
jgi:hypothetical protein